MKDADQIELNTKKLALERIREDLKKEFFGIDHCIDSVIESIKTWYMLPQIIVRPTIVNLWGLTGVGKTALVRSLVNKLGMSGSFVEIQMDGFSNGTNGMKTICDILDASSIAEEEPGIILLDEFQRFRTVGDRGEDLKVERYADVWTLLSDGYLPNDFAQLTKINNRMSRYEYWDDCFEAQKAEEEAKSESGDISVKYFRPVRYARQYYLSFDDAKELKTILRLKEDMKEIMSWTKEKSREIVKKAVESRFVPPLNYTKCLIFVSGNLDSAFQMSGSVEDCDTSADVFHDHTKKIGVIQIKKALSERFRPEQIARLGNNHIVYPSLSESAYMSLIRRTCQNYAKDAEKVCGIGFEIKEEVYKEIYENAVYPTQGTRPVFTSIHKLFGSPISDAILWAIEAKIDLVSVGLGADFSSIIFASKTGDEKRVKIDFDIRKRRNSRSEDFNALVAVHEAGHAIVYAELFNTPPVELAINVASFNGGYNLFKSTSLSKSEVLDQIATSMAGIVAEELVFGQEMRSTGCESDVEKATRSAAKYVRRYAMDGFASMTMPSPEGLMRSDFESTDLSIETIVKDQKERAQTVLTKHRGFLVELSKTLMKERKMDAGRFVEIAKTHLPNIKPLTDKDISGDYFSRLEKA